MFKSMHSIVLLAAMCFVVPHVFADAVSDAQTLKDDALEMLKANASTTATAEQYATCILKLERAQGLLEASGNSDNSLAQEVGSTLFWARKFSDVNVVAAIERMRKSMPPIPAGSGNISKLAKSKSAAPVDPHVLVAEAREAYSEAESFAHSHTGDDYAIALRWFQMANEHPGTDYAIRALTLARSAQLRFSAKSSTHDELPNSPEMNLVKQGDELASAEKFEESFAVYKSSLKVKETLVAHKRLAKAFFNRARQMKDLLLPQIETADAAIASATKNAYTVHHIGGVDEKHFNPSYPPLLDAQRKMAELKKQSSSSTAYFNDAESEFKAVLRLSPNEKDLEAAGHIALCWMSREDASIRARARLQIVKVLADYKPASDIERSLYEFCKTSLDQIH